MNDHWIYTDYGKQVKKYRKLFEREMHLMPETLLPLANYYVKNRLFILNEIKVKYDSYMGRPVPYLVFWLSKALGLFDQSVVDQLALSLYYISIIVSIRDDLADGRVVLNNIAFSESNYIALDSYFSNKYYKIFKNIFQPDSAFWFILTECFNQWSNYQIWDYIFKKKKRISPFSKKFLAETSSYLVAITFPTLAAIALLTKSDSKIESIKNFLKNYCMGWKITDDLKDWRKDLFLKNYNHSTIIYEALNVMDDDDQITETVIESIFLNKSFVKTVYNNILYNYSNAKECIEHFNSNYLNEFIETQIKFYTQEKNLLLSTGDNISKSLSVILNKK